MSKIAQFGWLPSAAAATAWATNVSSFHRRKFEKCKDRRVDRAWNFPFVCFLALFLMWQTREYGILLPKLFWPTVRKHCSSDREKLFEIWGWRPRIFKNFEITRTIYSNSERSEQFLVTECFFNLFLEVSQTW